MPTQSFRFLIPASGNKKVQRMSEKIRKIFIDAKPTAGAISEFITIGFTGNPEADPNSDLRFEVPFRETFEVDVNQVTLFADSTNASPVEVFIVTDED